MIALRKQLGGLVAPLMVLALAACESPSPTGTGDAAPSAPAFVLRDQDTGETPANVPLLNNHFKLCKVGPDPSFVATFQVTEIRYPGTPQEVVATQQIKLKAGTCKWVATNADDPIIQVEELLPPGVRVDYIEVRTKGLVKTSAASPPTEYANDYIIDDESSMEELIGRTAAGVYPEYSHAGAVAIFHNTTTPPPAPKLEISKTAGAASVAAGQPISFSITVSNTGDGDATDVVLEDALPSGAGLDWTVSPAVAGCTISGTPQALECEFDVLGAGESVTVEVVSPTAETTCGVFDNEARVSAAGVTPVTSDEASVEVKCKPGKPSLKVTKTADDEKVDAGSPIGFVITVTNQGTGVAEDVSLLDVLPLGWGIDWKLEQPVAGCAIKVIVVKVLVCSFGDLPAGETRTIHLVSPTTEKSKGVYLNLVKVWADNHDHVLAGDKITVEHVDTKPYVNGCSVSYWKYNTKHWYGYKSTQKFKDVFGVSLVGSRTTLYEALKTNGGGKEALAREAVAALLNARSTKISYGKTPEQIIEIVKDAYRTKQYDQAAEQLKKLNDLKCPLK